MHCRCAPPPYTCARVTRTLVAAECAYGCKSDNEPSPGGTPKQQYVLVNNHGTTTDPQFHSWTTAHRIFVSRTPAWWTVALDGVLCQLFVHVSQTTIFEVFPTLFASCVFLNTVYDRPTYYLCTIPIVFIFARPIRALYRPSPPSVLSYVFNASFVHFLARRGPRVLSWRRSSSGGC